MAKSNVVDVSGFASELGTILSRYSSSVAIETEVWLADTAKKTAKRVKANARSAGFKNDPKYANGWVAKKVGGRWVVFNKNKPGLAHLLENGHDVIQGGVKVGRSRAFPHIAPAADEIGADIKELEERLAKIK